VVDDRPVPENLRMSVWSLRRYRALRFAVNGEPARKGRSGSRAAISFQRQVMDQMEAWRRFPMTGPVALDLCFRSLLKGPPAIHNAAKHALDVLGPALEGNARPRRRHVLYRDDRQVKFLYVDLDQGWAREARPGQPGPALFTSLPGEHATSPPTCVPPYSLARKTMTTTMTPTARSSSPSCPTNPT
jgi:hypothetical protein